MLRTSSPAQNAATPRRGEWAKPRAASTYSTPRRLMLLITDSAYHGQRLSLKRMPLANDCNLIRSIPDAGNLSWLLSTRFRMTH